MNFWDVWIGWLFRLQVTSTIIHPKHEETSQKPKKSQYLPVLAVAARLSFEWFWFLLAASWLAAISCFRALANALPTTWLPKMIIWAMYFAIISKIQFYFRLIFLLLTFRFFEVNYKDCPLVTSDFLLNEIFNLDKDKIHWLDIICYD